MKKPFAILLLLFSYSSLYSQSWWDKAWWGGGGMGYGKNGASFQATGVSGSSVFHIAGNIFNGRSEEDTFQFSPNLFDDKDRIRPGGADMDAWQEDNDFVANHWRSGEENVWGAYNQFTNPMRQVYMQLKVDF